MVRPALEARQLAQEAAAPRVQVQLDSVPAGPLRAAVLPAARPRAAPLGAALLDVGLQRAVALGVEVRRAARRPVE